MLADGMRPQVSPHETRFRATWVSPWRGTGIVPGWVGRRQRWKYLLFSLYLFFWSHESGLIQCWRGLPDGDDLGRPTWRLVNIVPKYFIFILREGKLHGSKWPGGKTPPQGLPTTVCNTKNPLTRRKKMDI